MILDIDPTSALFWEAERDAEVGLRGAFVGGGISWISKKGMFCAVERMALCASRRGMVGIRMRKRERMERMERGMGWSAGFAMGGCDGGEDTNRKSRSQDEGQESSSWVNAEIMSSVDDGSEQSESEFKSEDGMNGPPNTKKAKLRVEDVRGQATEAGVE